MIQGIDPSTTAWWLIPVLVLLGMAAMYFGARITVQVQILKKDNKIIGAILSGILTGLSVISGFMAVVLLFKGGHLLEAINSMDTLTLVFFPLGTAIGIYTFIRFPKHRTYNINGYQYTIGKDPDKQGEGDKKSGKDPNETP